MSRPLLLSIAFAASAAAAGAQTDSARQAPLSAADSVFLRARRMVADGQGMAGRALVDSLVRATPVSAPGYAEALYWRAVIASTAADAERDYRRVAIEYSLSPRAPEALLRLAQLEISRGDRTQAIGHLERLVKEHPAAPSRPTASYWLADQLLSAGAPNDLPRACSALADARAGVSASSVELRNQIEFYSARCEGVGRGGRGEEGGVTSSAAPAPGTNPGTVPGTTPATAPSPRTSFPSPASTPPRDTAPSVPRAAAQPGRLPSVTPVAEAPASGPATGVAYRFSVQVAAYTVQKDAERLVAQLKQRGYAARIEGEAAPFRVRIGRYATRAEAAAAAEQMKAKKIFGFVAEATPFARP